MVDNNDVLPSFPRFGIKLACLQKLKLAVDETWTTTDVCNKLIKPETETQKCSFSDLFYTLYLDERHPLFNASFHDFFADDTPQIFVSHAWSYKFHDLVEAIEAHFDINVIDNSTLLWVDILLNNQWSASKLPQIWWKQVFLEAIQKIGHTMCIALPWYAPVTLTRSWCLWELYCSRTTGAQLSLQLSRSEVSSFQKTLREDPEYIMKALCKIDVGKSDAFNPDDKEMIFAAVRGAEGAL